jgi:hypothetical protein
MAPEQRNGSNGTELGRFLRALRTRVTPADVGLPAGSGIRRTPGLRREELATLAGISIDFPQALGFARAGETPFARLERGTETRPSPPPVIDALARALRLGEGEHRHLRELVVRAERPATEPAVVPSSTVPPGTELILESLRPNPAYVVSRTFDLLAANPGGLRLLAGLADWPAGRRNLARYLFLHPTARTLWDDWDQAVRSCVSWLRALSGIEPDAPDFAEIIDELLLKSPEFARMWDSYVVVGDTSGRHVFHHPEVGDVTLGFQGLTVNGTEGQHLVVFYTEPGTADHDAMTRLDTAAQHLSSGPGASGEGA